MPAAFTQAVLFPPDSSRSPAALREWRERTERQGFNTRILPIMSRGRVWPLPGGASKARWDTTYTRALDELATGHGGSHWLLVDPLTATTDRKGSLGRLAERHREWLLRNTQGRTTPLGDGGERPLFSWVNTDYRRFLGDLLVRLFEHYPAQGLILDLRALPLACADDTRWFCCSYQSQVRAETALGVDFEALLADAPQEEVRKWQAWVFAELRAFAEHLFARVNEVRRDIGWKAWLRPMHLLEGGRCLADLLEDDLVEEVLLDASGGVDAEQVAACLAALDPPRLVLPTTEGPEEAKALLELSQGLPLPGIVLEDPGSNAELLHCPYAADWSGEGALEDHPLLAAREIATSLWAHFGEGDALGEAYRQAAARLAGPDADSAAIAQSLEGIRAASAAPPTPRHEQRQRDMRLVESLLRLVRPAAIVT